MPGKTTWNCNCEIKLLKLKANYNILKLNVANTVL